MKSWISKALLGLFIAAPSVMARLPSTNGTVGGIYLKSKGMTTTETRMLQNSLGLWLSGMLWEGGNGASMYRYQAYPDGAAAAITVEKIIGSNPKYTAGNCPHSMWNSPLCAVDINRTKNSSGEDASIYIKVYTKYANGSSVMSTETQFQNLMTGLIGTSIDPNVPALFAFHDTRIAIPDACNSEIANLYGGSMFCGEDFGLHRIIQIYANGIFYLVKPNYTQFSSGAQFWWDNSSIPAGAKLQHSRYILAVGNAWFPVVESNSYSVQLPGQTNNRTWLIKDAAGQVQPTKCVSMTQSSVSGYGYTLPTENSPTDPNAQGVSRHFQLKGMQVSPVFRQENTVYGSHVLGGDNGSCNTFLGYALDVMNGN